MNIVLEIDIPKKKQVFRYLTSEKIPSDFACKITAKNDQNIDRYNSNEIPFGFHDIWTRNDEERMGRKSMTWGEWPFPIYWTLPILVSDKFIHKRIEISYEYNSFHTIHWLNSLREINNYNNCPIFNIIPFKDNK